MAVSNFVTQIQFAPAINPILLRLPYKERQLTKLADKGWPKCQCRRCCVSQQRHQLMAVLRMVERQNRKQKREPEAEKLY